MNRGELKTDKKTKVEEGTWTNRGELKTDKKKKKRKVKEQFAVVIRETYTLAESVRIHRSFFVFCFVLGGGSGSEILHINFGNRNGW